MSSMERMFPRVSDLYGDPITRTGKERIYIVSTRSSVIASNGLVRDISHD